MSTLFALLALLSPVALVAGLIQPSWVLPWSKTRTRGRAALTYGISTFVFLILTGITAPEEPVTQEVAAPSPSPEAVSPSPSPTPPPTTPVRSIEVPKPQVAPQQGAEPLTTGGLQPGREYDITKEAELREGPGENYAKKINQKASDVLKTIQYMSVDSSVTIKLLQVKDRWAEVQITQPEYLATTHRGWIPKDSIHGGASTAKIDGWVRHTCRVYQGKSTTSKVVGFLAPPASISVADDGSGWLRVIQGPIKVEGSDRFLDNPDFDAGLYIEAANFTTTMPGKW